MPPTQRPQRPSATQLDAAIQKLEHQLSSRPEDVKSGYNLALLLIERNRHEDARRHLDRLIRIAPAFAPAAFARGRLALDHGDLVLAERLMRTASGAPALALDSHFVLAEVLERMNRKDEAVAVLEWVIAHDPPSPAPYSNLGQLLVDTAADKTLAVAERGLARFPRVPRLHVLKGFSQLRLGDPDGAVATLRHVLKLDPNNALARGFLLQAARQGARWDDEERAFPKAREVLKRLPRGQELMIPLHAALNFPFSCAELLRIAQDAAAFHSRGVVPLPPVTPVPGPRRLTIGYLSPDYRCHPIAYLVADIFAAHDPKRVRALALSVGPDDGDPIRSDIAAASDFIDLRKLSDRAAAERIRAEGVDILVDLSLYTHHHRPGIAAHRPAPIQVAWLGLPATTGAPWFDYVLVDDIVAPPEHADRFTETLVHLPCGYQPNRRLGPLGPTPGRAALGLPENAVVFGCFNAHLKIDRDSFDAWLAILKSVPGSVLWLLAPPDAVAARYRDFAARHDVAPERLIFAPKTSRAAHLARLGCADVLLDCLIYGAHTTCSDALRTGVPMLTVLGEQFAARVAASLVTRAGLPDLVLPDRDAFIAEGIRLGLNPAARNALRRKLAAAAASTVFDPEAQARALEDVYTEIWTKHLGA